MGKKKQKSPHKVKKFSIFFLSKKIPTVVVRDVCPPSVTVQARVREFVRGGGAKSERGGG